MSVIHEVRQMLWVDTPHGTGQVLFIVDYGPHENIVFVVALEKDGQIKCYSAFQVRLHKNDTFGINLGDGK